MAGAEQVAYALSPVTCERSTSATILTVMTSKGSMIDALGERALLLPHKLEEALAANDRLKVCFTLLQAAERHADHPEEPVPDFSAERHAAGMDGGLDELNL